MKRILAAVFAAVSFTMSALPVRVEAIPVVSIGSAMVGVGDTFTIPFSITDAVDLTSFQFDLFFDGSQVTLASITESPFFTQGDATVFVRGFVDNVNGQILGVFDAGISPLALSNVFLNFSDSALQ